MSEQLGTIRLPARDIVVPSTVSSEARAVMANPPAQRVEFLPWTTRTRGGR